MAYKSLEIKGLSQRIWCTNRLLWHTNSNFYGIQTPPFMLYEPFLLGVGVAFNILIFVRAATLQKCGSEKFLRFSLPKVSWNWREILGEIFRATFSRVWVCEGKFHQNFTSKTVYKTENFTQISLCWGAALIFGGKLFWVTFLASKKNFPGRWWIQQPYQNQESHIYHRNLSSVAPSFFFVKEKFCTGARRCMLSFSQRGIGNARRAPDYSSNLCPPKTFAILPFRAGLGPPSCCFSYIKGPKHPLKKSYSRRFGRTEIRWVIWCGIEIAVFSRFHAAKPVDTEPLTICHCHCKDGKVHWPASQECSALKCHVLRYHVATVGGRRRERELSGLEPQGTRK